MMTEQEVAEAAATMTLVEDFDGETGYPTGNIDSDGETTIAEICGKNFRRWSDLLDLRRVC